LNICDSQLILGPTKVHINEVNYYKGVMWSNSSHAWWPHC